MKKLLPVLMALALSAASLAGCSANTQETTSAQTSEISSAQTGPNSAEDAAAEAAGAEQGGAAGSETAEGPSLSGAEKSGGGSPDSAGDGDGIIRVGSLKGPTSIGLVSLMNSEASVNHYDFTMVTAADELTAGIASGKLDIALVPANVASVLYHKTEGGVTAIDINTLGVLYAVSSDASIKSVKDLKGKTIYLTGKGTTPDYVLRYLLEENGLSDSDVTLQYKSEPTEVAALLAESPDSIGLLPQPFVTVACAQNEALKIVLDLTEEWDQIQGENGSRLVTGVTLVRTEYLKEHEESVKVFLSDHQVSAEEALKNPGNTAELVVKAGIIEKAPIAKKALPYCNITYIDGTDMKNALSGYLNVLFAQDPKSIGGALPGDDFYYSE